MARQERGLADGEARKEASWATQAAGSMDAVRLASLIAVAGLMVVIVRAAWICDDSFITMRTIDNLVHGYGLTWNVAERVQPYTHPLWMLLLSVFYAVTREAYYTLLAVSLVISLITALWLAVRVAVSSMGALLAVLILMLSKAYVDYSTSGLENPLTFLLLALFISIWLPAVEPADANARRRSVILILLAALMATNRMDTLLLALPAVVASLLPLSWRDRGRALMLGMSPFLAWELFSIVYYGFPFPNSAYAKLGTGIPRSELIQQGFHYVFNSAGLDPVSLMSIGAAILFVAWRRVRGEMLIMAGVALYLVYIVWIGGDFMSGRFFGAPLLASVAMLARWRPDNPRVFSLLPCLVVVLVGLSSSSSPVYTGAGSLSTTQPLFDRARITDERAYYYPHSGLLNAQRGVVMPYPSIAQEARAAREAGTTLLVKGGHGFFGYFAGPSVFIIDPLALTDPLLARLPVAPGRWWRIGHFTREIPPGYEDTLRSGVNQLADPQVAELYDALTVVTRGPLLSGRRIKEIWKLNTGAYRIDTER